MADLDIPIPKYRVGQTIYRATCERSTEPQKCPDCGGSQKWFVTTPSGSMWETGCQRCTGYHRTLELIPVWVPVVVPMVIRSVEVRSTPMWEDRDLVVYYERPSCSGYVVEERDVITDEAAAMAAAQALAATKTAELHEAEGKKIARARELNALTIHDEKIRKAEHDARDAMHQGRELRERIEALAKNREDVPGLSEALADAVAKYLLEDE